MKLKLKYTFYSELKNKMLKLKNMKALKLSVLALFISVVSFAQKVEDKAQTAKLQVNLPATTSTLKWEQDKNKIMEGKGTFILEKAF